MLTEYTKLSTRTERSGKNGRFISGVILPKKTRQVFIRYANRTPKNYQEIAKLVGGLSYFTLIKALNGGRVSRVNAARIQRFLEDIGAQ